MCNYKRVQFEINTVRDITWMSGQSVHLTKWMHALEQVTDGHLAKCKMYQISDLHEWHLPKCHTSALSQVISFTVLNRSWHVYSVHACGHGPNRHITDLEMHC